MHGTAAYFQEKARQCRRLLGTIGDARAITLLTTLAEEYEAKAKAIEKVGRTSDHPVTTTG